MTKRTARRLLLFILCANLLWIGWALYRRSQPPVLRVTFLDVGQGDSLVIETPSGKVLVVDTGGVARDGGDNQGQRVVVPFLQSEGVNRIDALLLTHPHADHIGGAKTLIERFPVGLLMDNGQASASPLMTAYLDAARARSLSYKAARPGQQIDCGDGAMLKILAPTEAATHGSPNNASLVARLEFGQVAFLLTGDAEAEEEEDLLARGANLACDVLKTGHHGSRTSSTSDFLAAAHPRAAVISVGARNLYADPNPEVVARLQAGGAQVYRTDERGAITCRTNGQTVEIETMRQEAKRGP